MKTIQVNLPSTSYQYKVRIGSGILKDSLNKIVVHYTEKKVFIITNETIHKLYPDFIQNCLDSKVTAEYLILQDGEKYKNLETLSQIYDFLAENKANRKSLLIAFGGGVIGDMAGFAAATYMRGIPYIQIPTTLLSQVDSGIGGKTAINHAIGKNLIGSFKQPLETIIDVDFLETLPQREFVAGYAELIKHGIIRDTYLFQILKRRILDDLRTDRDLLIEAIFRSCEVKARVVEKDEKESNQRAVLNFGHTIGHFLETFTNYKLFLHGEAVAIGMDFATWWSFDEKLIKKEEYQLIHDHLSSLGIHQKVREATKEEFQKIVEIDKKSASEGIRFVGLTSIGQAVIFDKVTSESLWNKYQMFLQTDTFLQIER